MTNYANWFAYYRTRIQAVKTVTSLAFNDLVPGTDYRVGFHTLSNNPTTTFQNIALFDAAQRTAWVQKLFGISITTEQGHAEPRGDGPRRRVLRQRRQRRAGRRRPTRSCSPARRTGTCCSPTASPTSRRCRPRTCRTRTRRCPTLPETVISIPALVPGQPWPPLLRRRLRGATNNSAADYATYYWVTDLRTSGGQPKNNVPGSDRDPATWQHLQLRRAVARHRGQARRPATSRTPRSSSPPARSSGRSRSRPSTSPTSRGSTTSGTRRSTAAAASSTRSRPRSCAPAWARSWPTSRTRPGPRRAPPSTSVKLSGTNNYVYRVGFEPGWSGSLTKVQIDPKTGKEVLAIWNAADQLTTQVTKTVADARAVVHQPAGSSPATRPARRSRSSGTSCRNLQDSFAPGKPTRGKALVAYLRGSAENEGTEAGKFRAAGQGAGRHRQLVAGLRRRAERSRTRRSTTPATRPGRRRCRGRR